MTKILPVLLLLLMGLHLIKPFGCPGLRHRRDFWKIAAAAIFMMAVVFVAHFRAG